MGKLICYYRFLQLISIDIALGSTVLSMSIAHVLSVTVSWVVYIALFLCVWMIYTLDHLLDAKKTKGVPSMGRHSFHQKQGGVMFCMLLITAMMSLGLLFFIPTQVLLFGVITAGVVSGYFLLAWWVKIFVAKELLIAVLYGIGVCLAPFSLSIEFHYIHLFILLEVIILAFTNLLIFSYFEEDKDRVDGFHSWATIFGKVKTAKYLCCVLVLGVLIISFGGYLFMADRLLFVFHVLMIHMWLILSLIYFFKEKLLVHELYRFLGDVVFILPAIVLWV